MITTSISAAIATIATYGATMVIAVATATIITRTKTPQSRILITFINCYVVLGDYRTGISLVLASR